MNTRLLFLENMQLLTCEAVVQEIAVENETGRSVMILDQTVFYPQGGGQPYDQGKIVGVSGVFDVAEVRYFEGIVRHYGVMSQGNITQSERVTCNVDAERRKLHSRLHSAGHVIDMAVAQLKFPWKPGKGYHFPAGPYVEYEGSLEGFDKEALARELENICNHMVTCGIATHIVFADSVQMHKLCRFVPENLPQDKPSRVVMYGDFGVPCGGTHVAQLADIGHITIRKVKPEKGMIRVSYQID
jgi:Ser-tRNA(Ala) deacylase AlaX